MKAHLASVIDEIANRADEFLSDVRTRAEARAGIKELLAADYPSLAPPDAAGVVDGVMAVLEREDFFGVEFVGDPLAESDGVDED